MSRFTVSSLRDGSRGSIQRLTAWTLPITGKMAERVNDTAGEPWFYATLDEPLDYRMPNGIRTATGSSQVSITDVVLRPHFLGEEPTPGMQAFPMDFAVVLDPGMRTSKSTIDLSRIDFIAVVEVDAAAEHTPAEPSPEAESASAETQVLAPAEDRPAEPHGGEPDQQSPSVIPDDIPVATVVENAPPDAGPSDVDVPAPAPAAPPADEDDPPVTVEDPVATTPTPPAGPVPRRGPERPAVPVAPPFEFVEQVQGSVARSREPVDFSVLSGRPVPDSEPAPAPRHTVARGGGRVAAGRNRKIGMAAGAAALALGCVVVIAMHSIGSDDEVAGPQPEASTSEPASTTTTTKVSPKSSDLAALTKALPAGYLSGACSPAAEVVDGGIATTACGRNEDQDGPSTGTYTLFDDPATLGGAFDRDVAAAEQRNCPGEIQSPGAWHRNASPDKAAGMLFCGTKDQLPIIMWTDSEKMTLNTVQGGINGPDLDTVYAWWTQHS